MARFAGTPWTIRDGLQRFNRWSARGIYKKIFDTLASKLRDGLYLTDGRIVKAPRAASRAKRKENNQAIGISRGGCRTKIRAIVDSKGRSLNFLVTRGQAMRPLRHQ
jgi:transposase